MLVSVPKMALPVSFLLDVVTLAIVGLPVLLVKYLSSPTILGFFCSDEVRTIFISSFFLKISNQNPEGFFLLKTSTNMQLNVRDLNEPIL